MAARVGLSLPSFMGAWRSSIQRRMMGKGGTLQDQLRGTVSSLGIEPAESLLKELADMERRRLEESAHLYPAAVPILQRLARSNYQLGLLSNVSDGAAIPLWHLGLDRLFDELILSYRVGLLKPDPAIYELACRRLGTYPTQTVFVADGGFGELDAAEKLGIYTVIVEQDHQSRDYGSSTMFDTKIHDLSQLEELLAKLNAEDPEE